MLCFLLQINVFCVKNTFKPFFQPKNICLLENTMGVKFEDFFYFIFFTFILTWVKLCLSGFCQKIYFLFFFFLTFCNFLSNCLETYRFSFLDPAFFLSFSSWIMWHIQIRIGSKNLLLESKLLVFPTLKPYFMLEITNLYQKLNIVLKFGYVRKKIVYQQLVRRPADL